MAQGSSICYNPLTRPKRHDAAEDERTINQRIYQTTGHTRNAMIGENWSKLVGNWLETDQFPKILVSVFPTSFTPKLVTIFQIWCPVPDTSTEFMGKPGFRRACPAGISTTALTRRVGESP